MKLPPFSTRASQGGRLHSLVLSAGVAALFGAAAILWTASRSEGLEGQGQAGTATGDPAPAPAAGPIQSLGVYGLLRAVPFTLSQPYRHDYAAERPEVSRGWILALRVQPGLVQPTNQFQPVLYADLKSGPQTLERFNQGHLDGVSIAFLPDVGASPGAGASDLTDVPIWFGAPELPERLSPEMIQAEANRASSSGSVFRLSAAQLRSASGPSGGKEPGVIALQDRTALEETAAELVLELAPGEAEFAQGILVPR